MTVDVLGIFFFYNLALTNGFFLALLLALVARKFRFPDYPFAIAAVIWCGLILSAVVVAIAWLSEFFSHGEGLVRMALVPVLMGALPLFVFAIIALFLRPRRRRFGEKYPQKTQ